jgi:hypothetical protein
MMRGGGLPISPVSFQMNLMIAACRGGDIVKKTAEGLSSTHSTYIFFSFLPTSVFFTPTYYSLSSVIPFAASPRTLTDYIE